MGKVTGGLIGITRNATARDRWCLTSNEKAQLSDDTREMFGLVADTDGNEFTHKDCTSTRKKRDANYAMKLKAQLEIFSHESVDLLTITTGDVTPDEVKRDQLTAQSNGNNI